jgi:hypothetical protein
MATPGTKVGLLNSWKEIASYLGRGVRTAQRWERYGLPVKRVAPGPRASVIADAAEIDRWIHRAHKHPQRASSTPSQDTFRREVSDAVTHAKQLQQEMAALRETGRICVQTLLANIARLEQNCARTKQLASLARSPESPSERL